MNSRTISPPVSMPMVLLAYGPRVLSPDWHTRFPTANG